MEWRAMVLENGGRGGVADFELLCASWLWLSEAGGMCG